MEIQIDAATYQLRDNKSHAIQAACEWEGLPNGITPKDLMKMVRQAQSCDVLDLPTSAVDYLCRMIAIVTDQWWVKGSRPICFATCKKLRQQHGIDNVVKESTQGWIERRLRDEGLIVHTDNAKFARYIKINDMGEVEDISGVDLSPLLAKCQEMQPRVEEVLERQAAMKELRSQIGLARRTIQFWYKKALECDITRRAATRLFSKYEALPYERSDRIKCVERLEEIFATLKGIRDKFGALLEPVELSTNSVDNMGDNFNMSDNISNLSPTDSEHYNTRIQQDSLLHKESTMNGNANALNKQFMAGKASTASCNTEKKLSITARQVYELSTNRMRAYLTNGEDSSWSEIIDAAREIALSWDISEYWWGRSCQLMGRQLTAICVITMDAKRYSSSPIRSGGSYLQGCLKKYADGNLNIHHTIFCLLRKSKDDRMN